MKAQNVDDVYNNFRIHAERLPQILKQAFLLGIS